MNIRKKILGVLLLCSLSAIILTSIVAFKSIFDIRKTTLDTENEIILQAAKNSEQALIKHAKVALEQTAADKANDMDENLGKIKKDVQILSGMMTEIASHPEKYQTREIAEPNKDNAGTVTAQLLFSEDVKDKYDPILRRDIGYAANIQDFLVQNNNNSNVIVSSYIASKDGFTIMADRFSDRKFLNSDERVDFYNAVSRPWYQQAQAANELIFTDIVLDALGGGPCIICATPYYNNGQFAGVVGMGAFLDDLNKIMLNTKVGDVGFGFVINENGQVIISPRKTGELASDIDNPKDLRISENTSLAEAVKEITKGNIGVTQANIDGKECYLAYAPMKNTNWYFTTAIEVDKVIAPAKENHNYIINAAREQIQILDNKIKMTILGMGILVVILLFFIVCIGWKLSNYLTKPILKLSHGVQEITKGNLDNKIDVRTGDEIESLAISFNAMSTELKAYMKNLQQIVAEKQRIATELNVATSIQKNMLPGIFPPYPDRKEFDIYAVMYPAKEVGGDFYDFYLLDKNHLVMTIADVSDKGIPAAMFMVITKTILKNFAMSMTNPDDFSAVMQCSNRQLCENNEEMMFVTVFMGMLNLKTGQFIYVNAGHNPPLLRYQNDTANEFKFIPVERNCVLGINEDAQFIQQELFLHQGDELFFYTDGVTEATNEQRKIFTAERLQKALNKLDKASSCQDILKSVNKSVKDFVKETPQSDDITMLAIKLKKINDNR